MVLMLSIMLHESNNKYIRGRDWSHNIGNRRKEEM